ncbi:efflux RND transporter periplasmic adaptor subunit [Niveibacterium terrae]|uniref:efflux RND transporter periplasmic adaptor subunit n=1 Tax=Niveibacterium terrae TaxID=3373598 RepID=UPI003A958617
MKRTLTIAALALLLLAAVGAGYWLGHRSTATGTATARTDQTKKILYYRNPMGLADTSPVPKKDPMGMDYIPVFAGGDDGSADSALQIRISADKVQKLGVRTELATVRTLAREVRALGRVEIDESRINAVAPRFEGWVERLHVKVTGQPVVKGQALFEVWSPELASAQSEYAIARQSAEAMKNAEASAHESMSALADASLARLKNWGLAAGDTQALSRHGQARRALTLRSPVSGIVIEKKAVQGMRFAPGDTLYQIADLSSVWVIADANEQDIARIQTGQKARITVNAYPGKEFIGRVSFISPTLKSETRTVPVRVELANPGGRLKPGLFAAMTLEAPQAAPALTVPSSAVIDSGTRQIVLVQLGEGRFEPRTVRLGARSDAYVEVLDGIKSGESVVVAANFLIDAESNLKAALGSFSHPAAKPAASASAPQAKASAGHRGEGKIDAIDAQTGAITIAHQPIASLKWPAMTMDFVLANAALARGIQAGTPVKFEFVERKPGEWVITKLEAAPNGHAGH